MSAHLTLSGARHLAVFGYLDRDGTRESELARRIGITRQSVHQTVMELKEMGLVELVPDRSNRSAKLVVVTPLGRAHSRVALKAFEDLEVEFSRRIGKQHHHGGTLRADRTRTRATRPRRPARRSVRVAVGDPVRPLTLSDVQTA